MPQRVYKFADYFYDTTFLALRAYLPYRLIIWVDRTILFEMKHRTYTLFSCKSVVSSPKYVSFGLTTDK